MFFPFLSDHEKIFSKLGYFTDQEGIMRRYIREAERWKPHLENTKAAILEAANNKETQKVAILGSGWLLDVPIEELSERFREVWFFDIKHPVQIKRKVERIANVKLVETDVSGFAVPVYAAARNFKKTKTEIAIDTIKPQFDFDLSSFDLVVSCNILNQLDIILIDYLRKTCKISSLVESQLRKLIQETHLHLLPKSKSCLISDIEELSLDSHDRVIHRKSLVYTDKLPNAHTSEWTWHFDNHFTYKSSFNTWFRVVAVKI